MKKMLCPFEQAQALRRLCAEPAAAFGARLLQRAEGPAIPFRTFVLVARDMVAADPGDAAVLLAALIALQMCTERDDLPAAATPMPSVN